MDPRDMIVAAMGLLPNAEFAPLCTPPTEPGAVPHVTITMRRQPGNPRVDTLTISKERDGLWYARTAGRSANEWSTKSDADMVDRVRAIDPARVGAIDVSTMLNPPRYEPVRLYACVGPTTNVPCYDETRVHGIGTRDALRVPIVDRHDPPTPYSAWRFLR